MPIEMMKSNEKLFIILINAIENRVSKQIFIILKNEIENIVSKQMEKHLIKQPDDNIMNKV